MKPWYLSKTIWFNIVVASMAGVETSFQLLQSVLPVQSYQAWLFIVTVGNVALRAITTQGISKGAQ